MKKVNISSIIVVLISICMLTAAIFNLSRHITTESIVITVMTFIVIVCGDILIISEINK